MNRYYDYETRYYIQLLDFLKDNNSLRNDIYIEHNQEADVFRRLYEEVFQGSCPAHLTTGEINTLWCEFIVPQHFEDVVGITTDIDDISGKEKKFFVRFLDILTRTLPKYKVIISNYDAEENRLMDAIKTTNEMKYGRKDSGTVNPNLEQTNKLNITPAELGDFTGDAYANQVTVAKQTGNSKTENIASGTDTNTISSEKESKMARLNEIHDNWISVFNEWADEFKSLFMVNY